jgi:hypothetical protein
LPSPSLLDRRINQLQQDQTGIFKVYTKKELAAHTSATSSYARRQALAGRDLRTTAIDRF